MKKKAASLVFAAASAVLAGVSMAAPFTPGDLVVYRVGSGSGSLSSVATAVYLDEYSTTGALVQSIAMPTSGATPLTSSGSASSEGGLSISPDDNYITLTGYNASAGTTGVASSASATTSRVVGIVNTDTGAVDTTTQLNAFTGNNIRSAVTSDGTHLYVVGAATGVLYTTVGSTGTAFTNISPTVTNARQISIFGGNLYESSGSGTTYRIAQVGSGIPATATTATELPGIPGNYTASNNGPYQFQITTLDGQTVLYAANNAGGTIDKFVLTGGSYVYTGAVTVPGGTGAVSGLAGELTSGATPTEDLFATTPTSIYAITDDGSTFSINSTAIATAGINESFRGIVAVPEPATASLIICSGAALLLRRRRAEVATDAEKTV